MKRGKIFLLKQDCGTIVSEDGEMVEFNYKVLSGIKSSDLCKTMEVEYEEKQKKNKKGKEATKVLVSLSTTGKAALIGNERGGCNPKRRDAGSHFDRKNKDIATTQNISNDYRFLNPYNFVRYLESDQSDQGKTTDKKETPEQKLLGKLVPPTHDRIIGLNGEIKCKITTKTPLFISDSHGVEVANSHSSYRFFQYGGKKAIPGSSIRGMVRQVYEAVTNSCFSVFEDERKLSYHLDTGQAKKLVPARVEKEKDGSFKLHLLTGATGYKHKGPGTNEEVYAAWIKTYGKTVDNKANKTAEENPSSTYAKRKNICISDEYKHKTKCFALMEKMVHPARTKKDGRRFGYFKFWNVLAINKDKSNLEERIQGQEIHEGWLCFNNQNIENKHDERFFFRSENNPDTKVLDIPEEVVNDYNQLIEDYRIRHRENIKKREHPDQVDWDGKKAAYSRFILSTEKLDDNELVYALLEGNINNLTIKFIVPVSMPRVIYKKSIGSLLPESVKHCNQKQLCPACRLFGWVKGEKKRAGEEKNLESEKGEIPAYKGRLSFEHAAIERLGGKTIDEKLAILAAPKPTTERFYLLPKNKLDIVNGSWRNTKSGYDGPNKLRGRKFYRHHGTMKPENYRSKELSDQNRSIKGAVPEGSEFIFHIDFTNLSSLELGALIWSLEMDGKGFHRLGYAKPLGFGSIRISIEHIKVLDPVERYSSIKKSGIVDMPISKEQAVLDFKNALRKKYGKNKFEELENVCDLRALTKEPANNLLVHYPRPGKEPSEKDPGFNWFVGNKRGNHFALPTADKDTGGLPLMDKYGKQKIKR